MSPRDCRALAALATSVVLASAAPAFADSGDPLFGDAFSGPASPPFSWSATSGPPCYQTVDAGGNPVMQCDENSSVVVSGGCRGVWDHYHIGLGVDPLLPAVDIVFAPHILRVYDLVSEVHNS